MTIKQQGGIFGRNPTFNDVSVDGTLTADAVAITGGNIDGTIIGATTKANVTGASGVFDNLTVDTSTLVVNASSNRVGINVASPTAPLTIGYSGAEAQIQINNSSGSRMIYAGAYSPNEGIFRIFNSSNTEVVRIAAETTATYFNAGNVGVGTTTPSSKLSVSGGNISVDSGYGIDFSATSGTGTSELFDDYEEGSWQPVIGGVNTTSIAYYTKIGRAVYLTMDITSGGGASSASDITGLPYTPAIMHGGMQVVYDSVSASSGGLGGYIDTSSPRITIRGNGGTSAVNIAAGERIMAFGFYLTS